MRFKQFLNERIYSKDGEQLIISVQHSREASTDDAISTFMRRTPFEAHYPDAGDTTIYSLLNYVASPESTKLLSSIKGKGPYKIHSKQYDFFIEQLVDACEKLMAVAKPDLVLHPKSSSPLIIDFVARLRQRYPNVKSLGDAFFKKVLSAEDVTPLINTSHPDWEKFVSTHPHEVEKLKLSLKRQLENNKGQLELKKLYKPYLKFVKNFMELEDSYKILDQVIGKRVMVIDDVISSGATMLEMLRQLRDFEPAYLTGLTIFKRTGLQPR